MKWSRIKAVTVILASGLILAACGRRITVDLVEVAQSESLWTGVAVSQEGRIFVNYPRWFEFIPMSVAEILPSGEVRTYPDEIWNSWSPDLSPEDHFVCVQSVYVDDDNYLWILDPAPVWLMGGTSRGPKLVKVDLSSDKVVQTIHFDTTMAPPGSYLNDVRVETKRSYAYITDSGLGAIVVVNLATGQSRRLLAKHHSTKSEDVILVIEGEDYLRPDGSRPQIHSDGVALDAEGEYLYYQALTGRSLYRVRTAWLRDTTLSESQLGDKVELLGETGAADAIAFGADGNLYLTSIEHNAIRRRTPAGKVEMVVQSPRLKWPDGFAATADGTIYVTTSQLHLLDRRSEPFMIFKFQPRN